MNPIAPAGHQQAIANKAHTAEPKSELENAFLHNRRHLNVNGRKQGEIARMLLSNISYSIDEVHSVLLKNPQSSTMSNYADGIFLSEAYRLSGKKILQYDLDTGVHFLGNRLPSDVLLVNQGSVGNFFGFRCRGVIVNCGTTGSYAGENTIGGIVINAGETGERFCSGYEQSIGIALRDPASYDRTMGITLRSRDINTALLHYLEDFVRLCQGPTDRLYRRYGETPATTVQHDLRRALEVRK